MTPLHRPARLLVAGLVLGIAFDLFFNGRAPGISLPIYAALLIAGLFATARWEGVRALKGNLWMPVALLFFAAMGFVRANASLLFMNVSAALFLLTLIAVHQARRPVAEIGLIGQMMAPIQTPFMALLHGGGAANQVIRGLLTKQTADRRRSLLPILRGLLIAAPILLVFTALLTSADEIFAELFHRILSVDLFEQIARWAGHGALALTVGFVVAGGLAYAARREGEKATSGEANPFELTGISRLLGATEAIIAINAVNILFLAFVIVQVPYLFGGRLNIAPAGFTYADYARRGFSELVLVACLTLGMTVFLSSITRRDTPRSHSAFNLSNSLLLALTGVMLVSAFKRLWLYEVAFGFTRMRIYPHVFMIWLALLLGWFALTLWRRPDRFAIGVLIAALGFVGTLDVLNPDAFIVYQNYQHQQETEMNTSMLETRAPGLDSDYLTTLSDDAVPALVWLSDVSEGDTRAVIEEDLGERLTKMTEDQAMTSWPSYHLARSQAYRILSTR